MDDLVKAIIKEQGQIIGLDLAIRLAKLSGNISFSSDSVESLKLQGDPRAVLDSLLRSYSDVFGQTSINVCIDVIQRFPKQEVMSVVPDYVKNKLSAMVANTPNN